MARQNITVTITAGTPICVATGLSSAAMLSAGFVTIPQLLLNEISIQMKHGGTGLGYVMSGIRGTTSATQNWRVPSTSAATDVTAELAPATSTAPGGQWSDPTNNMSVIHGEQIWVDVSVTSAVIISFDTQQ